MRASIVKRSPPYTTAQIAFLKFAWESFTNEEIFRKLAPHSHASIAKTASQLGLKRKRTYITKKAGIKAIRDLREIHQSKAISLKALARITGYHHGMLVRYESGNTIPSLLKLIDWCDALGCELQVVQKHEPQFDEPRPDYDREIHRTCRTNFMTTSRFLRRCPKCRDLDDA